MSSHALPDLPTLVADRLKQPLPAWRAYMRFAPELSYGRQVGPPPPTARAAAVLVLLYPHQGRWHLPFTVRPTHLPTHAGQICFPGGRVERGEASSEAALRELEEELGVRAGVKLLGRLSPFYVFVSNARVVPWIGVTPERPEWQPSPSEVEEVLEVPLDALLDPANHGEFLVEHPHLQFRAPCIHWNHHRIWGATSMMLNEFLEIVREVHPPRHH